MKSCLIAIALALLLLAVPAKGKGPKMHWDCNCLISLLNGNEVELEKLSIIVGGARSCEKLTVHKAGGIMVIDIFKLQRITRQGSRAPGKYQQLLDFFYVTKQGQQGTFKIARKTSFKGLRPLGTLEVSIEKIREIAFDYQSAPLNPYDR